MTVWQDEASGNAVGATDWHSITEGSELTAADTITVTSGAHLLGGAATINTISGLTDGAFVYFRFKTGSAVVFGSGGNIKAETGTRSANRSITLRRVGGVWYEQNNGILGTIASLYVAKAGDTMTGQLVFNTTNGFAFDSPNSMIVDNGGVKGGIRFSGVAIPSVHVGSINFTIDTPAAGNTSFRVLSTGGGSVNVGIGTATPIGVSIVDIDQVRSATPGNVALAFGNTSKWGFRDGSANQFHIDYYNGATWSTPLSIDGSGNVGIGRAPAYKLDVETTGAASSYLSLRATGTGNAGILMDAADGDYTGNDYGFVQMLNTGNLEIGAMGADIVFKAGSSGTERARITSAGNVGIGTTSPSSYTSGADLVIARAAGNGNMTLAGADNGNPTIMFRKVSAPGTTTGYIQYDNASNWLRFGTGGSERIRIDSSGHVGIGVTPSYRMHIKSSAVNTYPLHVEHASNTNQLFGVQQDGSGYCRVYVRDNSGTTQIALRGTDGSIAERGRTVAMGEWQDRTPFTASDFFAGAGTLTVTAVREQSYSLVGKTITYAVDTQSGTISGTPGNAMYVKLPPGYTANTYSNGFCFLYEGGGYKPGYVFATPGGTNLAIYKTDYTNFATGTIYIAFTMICEIQ